MVFVGFILGFKKKKISHFYNLFFKLKQLANYVAWGGVFTG